jgi:hypothetical protein
MLSSKIIRFRLVLTLFSVGMMLHQTMQAQCDFINDITGISQSVLPIGDAANPTLYTQSYVLVDNQGLIFALNTTPDFLAVPAGFYNLYAVNYDNAEAATTLPLLTVGQPWFNVELYGNDDVSNCFDYTLPYGAGCPIVVCDEMTICAMDTLNTAAINFETIDHEQNYCLVCDDLVLDINPTADFALLDYPAAVAGANCQLFGINFNINDGNPLLIGDNWSAVTDGLCSNNCFDFIGMNLDIIPLSQPSGNGVSTAVDWWSGSCLGAQSAVNGGTNFSETVNNWCVPAYNPSTINARPDEPTVTDDLTALMGGKELFSRVPCVGTMDLTQHTIFYTVECDPNEPAQLDVLISNAGPNITGIQAALYGPVNALCPTLTGGTFVDCSDAGVGSQSGSPMGNINLSTNGNPGEVYLVIVDTEDRDQFTISSTFTLLNTRLRSFRGYKEEDHNRLDWEIETQQGVQDYVLERSAYGINYQPIATVQPHAPSTVALNYSYLDQNPGSHTFYYRLKMLHEDASYEYSNTVVLVRKGQNLGTVALYPNPMHDLVYIDFESSIPNSKLYYEIQDVIGQQLIKGSFDIEIGRNKLPLSVSQLPAATYTILLSLEGKQLYRKLIKQ